MRDIDAIVAAVRSYGVVPSTHGIPRWYVYRIAEAKAGEIPPSSQTFFDRAKAYKTCDRLNAEAVISAWRYG